MVEYLILLWFPMVNLCSCIVPISLYPSISFYFIVIRTSVICVGFYLRISVRCNDYLRITIGFNVGSMCVIPIGSMGWSTNGSCNHNMCCVSVV